MEETETKNNEKGEVSKVHIIEEAVVDDINIVEEHISDQEWVEENVIADNIDAGEENIQETNIQDKSTNEKISEEQPKENAVIDHNERAQRESTPIQKVKSKKRIGKLSVAKTKGKGIRKALTLQEKYDIIVMYEDQQVSRKDLLATANCGKTQIYDLIKNREKIKMEYLEMGRNPNTKRLLTKPRNNEIDSLVFEWFKGALEKEIPLTGSVVKSKAKEVAADLNTLKFKASNGWLESFRRRHAIVCINSLFTLAGREDISLRLSPMKKVQNTPKTTPLKKSKVVKKTKEEKEKKKEQPKNLPNYGIKVPKLCDLMDIVDGYDGNRIAAIYETKLLYKMLPTDENNDNPMISMLFLYYADGSFEKPLITYNPPTKKSNNYLYQRKYHNEFLFKRSSLSCMAHLKDYLRNLNNFLKLRYKKIIVFLIKNDYEPISVEFSNIKLIYIERQHFKNYFPLDDIIKRFKINYRCYLLKSLFSLIMNHKFETIIKNFKFNDSINLISNSFREIPSKFIENSFVKFGFEFVNFRVDAEGHVINILPDEFDELDEHFTTLEENYLDYKENFEMANIKCIAPEDYLNIDHDISSDDESSSDEDDSSDEETEEAIDIIKATSNIIELKNLLLSQDKEQLLDMIDELQIELNNLYLENISKPNNSSENIEDDHNDYVAEETNTSKISCAPLKNILNLKMENNDGVI